MPLAHIILGVLMDSPAHGYAIKKQLVAALPDLDPLNDGQLYPTLGRMEQSGWIRKQVVEQRRTPSKHLYRLTAAGRREFFAWLARDGAGAPGRSEFLQRSAFFCHLDGDQVAARVRAEQRAVQQSISRLEALAERLAGRDDDPFRRMLVEYRIRVQRVRRQWLEELLAHPEERADRPSALARAQNA